MATRKHDRFGLLFGPSINDKPVPSPEALKEGHEILARLEERDGTKKKKTVKKPRKPGPIADSGTWAIYFRKEGK